MGRKSGQPRWIEIVFYSLGGDHYIIGGSGWKRDWLANLGTNLEFIFYLKRGVQADVQATVEVLTDLDDREVVLCRILLESWDNPPGKVDHIIGRWVVSVLLIRFAVNSE